MDLANFLNGTRLMDVYLKETLFAWSNRGLGENLNQVKLDRFVISNGWNILPSLLNNFGILQGGVNQYSLNPKTILLLLHIN